jgi:hypothetical protein
MKPREEWPDPAVLCGARPEMQEFLEGEVPTAVFGATQPIQMRVEELISGVRATLALKIYGEDLDKLEELSAKIKGRGRRRAGRGRSVGRGQQGQAADGDQGRPGGGGALWLNADDILKWCRRASAARRSRPDRRHAPLRHRGAAGRRIPRQPVGDRGDSRSAPPKVPSCLSPAWRRSSLTRATPSCAAKRCSATPCCRWTCRAATWTASSRTPTRPSPPK